jgi:iron-sulfur cluster assembly protein CyaY
MTQADFDALADVALEEIQFALDASGIEADVESKADGVVELTFADGSKMVINRHRAAREIWVAARAGGFHFRWDGTAWRDTRDGAELFAALSKLISAQGGEPVVLAPRRAS